MSARQIARRKEVREDGSIVEIVIWELDAPVPPCAHLYRYRLAYVVDGICIVRYDNETGKGDHRHLGSEEFAYTFSGLEQLLADFKKDLESTK